jgi:hypothetical protein
MQAFRSTWISGGDFVRQIRGGIRRLLRDTVRSDHIERNHGPAHGLPGSRHREGGRVVVPGFAFLAAANVALQWERTRFCRGGS